MDTIVIPRVHPARFDNDRVATLAKRLGFDGEFAEHEFGVAFTSERSAVVHGQPGGRMGGLTTAIDLTRGIAPDIDENGRIARKAIDTEYAARLIEELLDEFALGPRHARSELALDVELEVVATEAVHFDGKRRESFVVKTDARARAVLEGIPVRGPRVGASAVFTDGELPLRLLTTTWDAVEAYEKARLISADEAVEALVNTRADRTGAARPAVEVLSADLAYWAGEYRGGADVLEPSWFVELISTGRGEKSDAPKQLVRLPAAA